MSAPARRLAAELVATLTPHLELPAARREWLQPLLLQRDDLAGDLDWSGAPRAFTARLVALCLSRRHAVHGPALLDELLDALAEEGIGLDDVRQAALARLREALAALEPDDLLADPAIRRRWQLALAGAGVAALALAVAVGVPYWRSCHRPMEGALRVAVASFGSGESMERSSRSLKAHRLAEQVAQMLDVELGALLVAAESDTDAAAPAPGVADLAAQRVGVRGPSLLCPVGGRDADTRAARAERLAERIGADILIYGTLVVEDEGDGIVATRLVPAFHVTDDPRRLRNAGEFAGSHELGTPIEDPDTITGGGVLGEAIRVRTSVLATFVVALSYFADRQYLEAERLLRGAADRTSWPDAEGKEVVYLFLGNVVLQDLTRETRLAEAATWFDRALGLDHEYARAQLGRAEVMFQLASGTGACEPQTVDPAGLEAAITAFAAAKAALHQPPLSQVPYKAEFGATRARFCQVNAGLVEADLPAIARPFEEILAAYDAARGLEQRQLRDWAAESAGMLGLIALLDATQASSSGDEQGTREARAEAMTHFERAIEIGDRHARDAVFLTHRANILLQQCDRAAAETSLDEARLAEDRARAAGESIGPSYLTFRDQVRAGALEEECVPAP